MHGTHVDPEEEPSLAPLALGSHASFPLVPITRFQCLRKLECASLRTMEEICRSSHQSHLLAA